ncbi:MAG TPA: PAS domain-containing protein [Sphingomicrobium sp.]|nr:PAS domain-containing protein [Sphingomicrobium sp.]
MTLALSTAEDYLDSALRALRDGNGYRSALDQIPLPIYVTDADGLVTYWNRACVDFAGREPELGSDKWCVTWQLYTTSGEPLPHEKCPMADAIRDKREVRGKVAIAARPDGSRRAFVPYPTPLFDQAGELIGAVNLLIDVSEEQAPALAEQAALCHRLARATHDSEASRSLAAMAEGYKANAKALRAGD